MNSWANVCEGLLLDGSSVNVVGLAGTGRTESIKLLQSALEEDWQVKSWTLDDIAVKTRDELRNEVRSFQALPGLKVLIIDDFGDFLVRPHGQWLEAFLLGATTGAVGEDDDHMRCVVVSTPRDREIVGAGSGLRERAAVVFPERSRARVQRASEWLGLGEPDTHEFCGANSHVLVGPRSEPVSRRGLARRAAQDNLPLWVGQLDRSHQERLATILRRESRWRHGDVDEALFSLVVPRPAQGGEVARPCNVFSPDDIRPLLLSERWPDRALDLSARRFRARCGNEPRPLWVDNYLSDRQRLDFRLLVTFLEAVLTHRSIEGLTILSRGSVDGRRISPADIVAEVNRAGASPDLASRLEWRLYDQQVGVNLHARQLVLPARGVSFSLPIATMVVGQTPVGNESGSDLPVRDLGLVRSIWRTARKVPGFGSVGAWRAATSSTDPSL